MNEKLKPAIENFGKVLMGKEVTDPDAAPAKKKKTLAEAIFDADDTKPGIQFFNFNQGSQGFKDFGEGTPAMLHGVEAVVPKNDIGQIATLLEDAGATNNTNNTTSGDVVTNNSTTIDMTTLNKNTEQLIALNEKVANHLNMLVTIGAMTEKNTKNTNNSLANMGGSLV